MPLDPMRTTLPNGVVVLAKETRTTPAVTMLMGVGAGAFHDPDGREGTSALVARVLDRGTTRQSAADIADELDGRGATLSVMAGRHQLTVSATCLAEDFDAVFTMVADIVRRPTFDPDEIATRRRELQTAIQQDDDDPGSVAVQGLMAELYRGHPYGRPPRGTVATVAGLSRTDLTAHHAKWFTPSGATVVVVGDVPAETVVRSAARALESWAVEREGDWAVLPAAAAASRRLTVAPMMSKAQADIAYGFVGIRRSDPDYYAAWVMNNVLGQYALGGRLGDSIRERQGMAYYVFSNLDATLAEGPLMIRAGVAAANVERTIASIDQEIRLVAGGGLTQKEVDDSKRYLSGSIPRQLETNAGIAGFLLSAELHGLGPDHDRHLPAIIEEVSLEDVHRVARRLLDPDRASIVVAGPWSGPPREPSPA